MRRLFLLLLLCSPLLHAQDQFAIFQAAREGDRAATIRLVNQFGSGILDLRDTSGNTPLIAAIQSGSYRCSYVDALIQLGADVNQPAMAIEEDAEGKPVQKIATTSLIELVRKRDARCIGHLLAAGANKEAADKSGKIAFDYATMMRRREIARLVQPKPWKLNLWHAIVMDDVFLVREFIEADAGLLQSREKEYGSFLPLELAALSRSKSVLQYLLLHWIEPFTPQQAAALGQTASLSQSILVHPELVSETDIHGLTLYQWAVESAQPDALAYLLQHKPLGSQVEKDALLIVAVYNNDPRCAKLLIDAGADPNVFIPNFGHGRQGASRYGSGRVAELLRERDRNEPYEDY